MNRASFRETITVGSDTWPSQNDYRDALQHPAIAFRDVALQGCKAETNKMGVPRARAGAFANVYKMMNGVTSYRAVRLFLYPSEEREERYRLVSEHLRRGRPASIIDFDYDPRGIRINREWFPVLVMDWVQGVSLGEWVRLCVQRRDSRKLLDMADRWVHLLEELRTFQIAHGDLQHDNVMVVDDEPVLVDYDGMCVPGLVGQPALEEGKPAYQHPARRNRKLALDLDHFSAWIILIGLRAIAADFSLYDRFVEKTRNENLLFMPEDLRDPALSPLWHELLSFPDTEVKVWTRRLQESLPDSFERIPVLSRAALTTDPFADLRKLCQARPRNWLEIDHEAMRQAGKPFPQELKEPASVARRRVFCREALEKAVRSRNLRQIVATHEPQLLDDWPECSALVAMAREAKEILKLVDALELALSKVGNGRAFLALWTRQADRLKTWTDADRFRQAADAWKYRIDACDMFLNLVLQPGSSEREIAEAWARLTRAGGHPDALSQRHRGELARARADLLDRLRACATRVTEDDERQFVAAWDDVMLQGCSEAVPLSPRLDEARERLALAEDLRKAVEKSDQSSGYEDGILKAAARLPSGYIPELASRIQAIEDRRRTAAALASALAADPLSDVVLANAYEKARNAGPINLNADALQVCAIAVKRRDCLQRIQTIDATLSLDELDACWIKYWDSKLLRGCPDAILLRPRLQEARERIHLLRELHRIIEIVDQGGGQERHIVDAASKLPAGYPRRFLTRIRLANERVTLVNHLRRALSASPVSDVAVADAWDNVCAARITRFDPPLIQRCDLAVERRDCLRKVRYIDGKLPLDQQDCLWVRDWNDELLRDCPDASGYLARYRKALERWQAWKTLEEVLKSRDLSRVRNAATDPLLESYPPVQRRREEIDGILLQADQVERVLVALKNGSVTDFLDGNSLAFIRGNPTFFRSCRESIEALLREWLCKEARLAAGDPPFLPASNGTLCRARWGWPHPGRVSHHLVATDRARFLRNPGEARDGLMKLTVKDHQNFGGGVQLLLVPEQRHVFVTVWPAIDLGWTEIVGQPLHVGPIPGKR